jgi:hypothetical protein
MIVDDWLLRLVRSKRVVAWSGCFAFMRTFDTKNEICRILSIARTPIDLSRAPPSHFSSSSSERGLGLFPNVDTSERLFISVQSARRPCTRLDSKHARRIFHPCPSPEPEPPLPIYQFWKYDGPVCCYRPRCPTCTFIIINGISSTTDHTGLRRGCRYGVEHHKASNWRPQSPPTNLLSLYTYRKVWGMRLGRLSSCCRSAPMRPGMVKL